MSLIAIPNVSEGRDPGSIWAMASAIETTGAHVLDVHSDARHHRSVFTVLLNDEDPVTPMIELALLAVSSIDLRFHDGVHPRLGVLDVCPFVPHNGDMTRAIVAARTAARSLGAEGIPVYLYGKAATRKAGAELPDLRRGGLTAAIDRVADLPFDFGPSEVDPRTGITCVGARETLIAFNVWLEGDLGPARRIAAAIRESSGGLPGVRAIGLLLEPGVAQVSMNLTAPDVTGIDAVFDEVSREVKAMGGEVSGTEIVGLVPERYMPDPNAEAARLLISPGRSLESVIEEI